MKEKKSKGIFYFYEKILKIKGFRMDSHEISEEILVLEKNLTRLKKDYKGLLGKSRNENGESIRMELNEMAKDLEQKTEFLIWTKKQLKKKFVL